MILHTPPDALLLLSTHCPAALADLVKRGRLGQLTVVNLESRPEAAQAYGVRSVPWVRIGEFELGGLRSQSELEDWAHKAGSEAGWADWFHLLLKEGQMQRVVEAVHSAPERLAALLPLLANPEASLNVRLGVGAVLEDFAGSPALAALTDRLGALAADADPRVRADACHTLALTRSPAARAWLEPRLEDPDADVREIATESLETLNTAP